MLCRKVDVQVVHGAPYKPSTQGSIEIANRTFKRRLRALQTQHNTNGCAQHLREIAIAINTSRSRALPHQISPYMVLFSREPRWGNRVSKEEFGEDVDNQEDEGEVVVGSEDREEGGLDQDNEREIEREMESCTHVPDRSSSLLSSSAETPAP